MNKKILLSITILLLAITTMVGHAGESQGNETQAVNIQINYQIMAPYVPMSPSSTGFFVSWDNGGTPKDNRVYYDLSDTDVGNYVNGAWSHWDNGTNVPGIRLTGLKANTTYYYKRQTWSGGVPDNSAPVLSDITLKPRVWTGPAEVMISPLGWMDAPANFKTVNISAAPLNINGRYVTGLLLTAIIYNNKGQEVDRVALSGDGPYYANYDLRSLNGEDGGYYVKIDGYPDMTGEFSALRWGCNSCHSAGGVNYPSNFNAGTVHPNHNDTTTINSNHAGGVRTNVDQCDNCHGASNRAPAIAGPYWVPHPPSTGSECGNCHKSSTSRAVYDYSLVGTVVCADCHNDATTKESVFADRYGTDAHKNKPCSDCHGTLSSMTTKPNCTTCHPRPGKEYLTAIPTSIKNMTHSSNKTVACGICHNSEHDIKGLTNDSSTCRNCHTGITHDTGRQCTTCHGNDPHAITAAGGDTCIECHGTNYPGANPMAVTTLVNISAFNQSIHQNINAMKNPLLRDNVTTNEDCWQCHFNKDMNRQNVRGCNYCHSNVDKWHGNANITTNWSQLW